MEARAGGREAQQQSAHLKWAEGLPNVANQKMPCSAHCQDTEGKGETKSAASSPLVFWNFMNQRLGLIHRGESEATQQWPNVSLLVDDTFTSLVLSEFQCLSLSYSGVQPS
uniref:Uncharacterized protein n=1 Tax=Sphaerodactylus townsendi TaxID=933632 RepID=A0ACB8EB73_9SAUR